MHGSTVGVQPHPDFFLFTGQFCASLFLFYAHIYHGNIDHHNNHPHNDYRHDKYHNQNQAHQHNHANHLYQNIYQSYHYLYRHSDHHDCPTDYSQSQSGNGKRQGIRCRRYARIHGDG